MHGTTCKGPVSEIANYEMAILRSQFYSPYSVICKIEDVAHTDFTPGATQTISILVVYFLIGLFEIVTL